TSSIGLITNSRASRRPEQPHRIVALEEIEQRPDSRPARAGERRVLVKQQPGVVTGGGQELLEVRHVGDAKLRHAALARAQHLAAAPQLQILLGDEEAVLGLAHHLEALLRRLAKRWLVEQHAVGLAIATSDAAAELVKLGEAEALSMLDD